MGWVSKFSKLASSKKVSKLLSMLPKTRYSEGCIAFVICWTIVCCLEIFVFSGVLCAEDWWTFSLVWMVGEGDELWLDSSIQCRCLAFLFLRVFMVRKVRMIFCSSRGPSSKQYPLGFFAVLEVF